MGIDLPLFGIVAATILSATPDLREVFTALRYVVHSGGQWRLLPHDFPPWAAVYQQTRRWLKAGVFEKLTENLRALLRQAHGRAAEPTASVIDSRTLPSTPESGARAGFDAGKRRKGAKTHLAVDTLGYPLALHTPPANEQDRAQVAQLTKKIQDSTNGNVNVAYADQAYRGEETAKIAQQQGVALIIVKLDKDQKSFVALPKRWVVERSFGWIARCRRLLHDFERLINVLVGLHLIAFTGVRLHQITQLLSGSS